jgi:glycosyltransferase involved in cell wall biosynthesis
MGDLWAGAEVQLATLLAALTRIPDLEISAVLFNEGRLADELRHCGVRTQVMRESQHHPWSLVRQLSAYFKRHPIDILHTHKYKDNVLGALVSIFRGVRYRVRTVHGMPEPHAGFRAVKRRLYHLVDSGVNRWLVDRVLAVSFDLRHQLGRRFGADKVTCIQNAVDLEQIKASRRVAERRRELQLGEHEFVIGAMGRLTPGKGFECFLRAAHIIRRQRPQVKFLVVGDGPLRGALQSLACALDLEEVVLFLGHRNDNYDMLALMDLFVLPSFAEGTPMVLLEALALARPVVASRVGGIPEVIEHGSNGLLVMPGGEGELAQSCMTLMDDGDMARRLGKTGQKHIAERFSARVMAEKVAEVYQRLVCGGENA